MVCLRVARGGPQRSKNDRLGIGRQPSRTNCGIDRLAFGNPDRRSSILLADRGTLVFSPSQKALKIEPNNLLHTDTCHHSTFQLPLAVDAQDDCGNELLCPWLLQCVFWSIPSSSSSPATTIRRCRLLPLYKSSNHHIGTSTTATPLRTSKVSISVPDTKSNLSTGHTPFPIPHPILLATSLRCSLNKSTPQCYLPRWNHCHVAI